MMTQEVLHNQGIIFLNGHFLTVLPRAVFRTQPKVCGRAFFLNISNCSFQLFPQKSPTINVHLCSRKAYVASEKKRNKLLYNFTQLCIILKMLPYVCFLFHCWVNLFSGCFRQVFFHLGDKKLDASCVRQVVILCSNDCMRICLVGLSIGCLR